MEQPKVQQSEQIAAALPAVTVLAALAYAAAAYFLLYSPQLAHIVPDGSLDLSGSRKRVAALQTYANKLDTAAAAFEKLNPDIRNRVSGMVAPNAQGQDMYVIMDPLASKNGMVLTNIDTTADETTQLSSGRKVLKVAVSLAGGSYPQLRAFLTDLESSLRIADVQGVAFAAGSTSYSLTMKTYFADGSKPAEAPVGTAVAAPAQ